VSYELHHADCMDFLPSLAPGSVDAIITDLPYGTTACTWDTVIPFAPMWEQVRRVLKPRGVFVTTASQPFTSALVMSNPEWFRYEWIWEKDRGNWVFGCGEKAAKSPRKHFSV
jgi:site-specific DNA-methyltransferase (adenine-specific)